MKAPPQKKKEKKVVPPPGRKMSKEQARDYVFTTYREAMEALAKQ